MIVDIVTGRVGVIVDAVTEVLRVENSTIDPPSSMVAHGDADYLKGIAKLSGRLIILLDLHKLLSQKAISAALKQTVNETRQSDEKDIAVKSGNGNKKKSAELADKNNSKEYASV